MTKIEYVIIGLIILVMFSIPIIGRMNCSAKTEGLGFNNKFSLLGGCLIEHKTNIWVPLENYRAVN